MFRRPLSIAAVICVFALSACGGGTSSGSALSHASGAIAVVPEAAHRRALSQRMDTVMLHLVLPSSANAGVDQWFNSDDYAAPPAGAPKGKLFVFLPSTAGTPSGYTFILREAALHGYSAIGLDYVNALPVDLACSQGPDPYCWGDYRDEVVTSRNTSRYIDVPPADALEQRLSDLLVYLSAHYPAEGWRAFLTANKTPDWQKIAMGGHSQGGGDALFTAKIHQLAKVCTFDDPVDSNGFVHMAAWLGLPGSTPTSRLYGFTNQDDGLLPYGKMIAQWSRLGMSGNPVSVLRDSPPYGNSHRLYTVVPGQPLYTHLVTVGDGFTPLNADGDPVYGPVWQYACFP